MRLNRIAFLATLLSILCFGATFKAWADDDEIETYGLPETHDFIQHRSYIGFFGTSADIDNNNDFNGNEAFITAPVTTTSESPDEEEDFIPAINRNFGFGGLVGHREGPWAIELSYWYSNHTGSINTFDTLGNPTTVTTSAVYSTINFDLKRYFFTTLPIQPFIDLGVNFAYLSSQNTSELFAYDTATQQYVYQWSGNQTDTGYGLNLGIGGELYLGDGFSLVGGVIQRFTTFQQINGASKSNLTPDPGDLPEPVSGATATSGTNQGSLEGNGLNFYLGMTVGIDQ
jgi:hypothetical protein